MPRPHFKIGVPRPKLPRPHFRLRLPRNSLLRHQAGVLWALVALAALATLPTLAPDQGSGSALGNEQGVSARDEAATRYQAWLRGRAAGQDPSAAAAAAQQAAAQQAAAGLGAAAPTPAVITPSASDSEMPAMALRAYRFAETWATGFDPTCKLSWSVLAGIGRIESNHGRHLGAAARFSPTGDVTPTILGPVLNGGPNTGIVPDTDGGRLDGDRVWDRAVGPMQFIPSTWQSLGRDGNGDGIANPNNFFDAAVSAAGYLCLSGGGTLADQANLRRAIYAYNHSLDYVDAVLAWANFYLHHQGRGSLLQVQVPTGPSSSIQPAVGPSGTGVATTPGGSIGTPASSGATTSPPSPTARVGSSSSSSTTSTSAPTTQPPTTVPPTTVPPTTAPPSSSSSTTTAPPTTTAPCATTTTSTSTSSTSSSTTTTTTTTTDPTTTTTTTTTLPPCPDQAADTAATSTTQ